MQKSPPKGPKSIPSQLQLPGGVVLKAMPFKIVAYNDDGSARLFELQPSDLDFKADASKGECVLFAREDLLRNPWPRKTAEAPAPAAAVE
jgi:hypothetical protein